jgi:S-adenosylmethionine:tRNA ribosyltransferase-isomerase
MKKPDQISLSNYNYNLPEEKIAVFPLKERDKSRLLIYRNEKISEKSFIDIPEFFDNSYRLVFNDTKVIHARLKFKKKTGAAIEVFCLEPSNPSEHQLSLSAGSPVEWKCLVGNLKKWNSGLLEKDIIKGNDHVKLYAEKIHKENNTAIIRFSWNDPGISFSEILEASGETPIPPYLNREAVAEDSESYQTVYSEIEGSVAAPTAGLHFTKRVLEKFEQRDIELLKLTLHVSAGTFTPVKDENAVLHKMHREVFIISLKFLESLIRNEKKIICVGTTSCRSLESLYWMGVKINACEQGEKIFHTGQWEVYDLPQNISRIDALETLIGYMRINKISVIEASTEIMISPGYDFRMTDVLITNFHQPCSTLLMLIAAFTGEENWRNIYDYALSNNFRFLSYGDSSVLFP